MIDDRLLAIKKPGRYIGGEWNSSRKSFADSGLRCVLCFPDMYEVGMSNLGLRILYSLFNALDGVCCERVFAPDTDMEKFLRDNNLPLVSLESQKPLAEFDLIGFNIGYELSYTNVLNVLELGGVPLFSAERKESDPLVIAGGTGVLNPEPLHAFVDAFFIGEGEEAAAEIAALVGEHKGKSGRKELLCRLAGIEGVYVPSLYQAEYDERGLLREFRPLHPAAKERIAKRFLRDLDGCAPGEWIVPWVQIVHDRICVEVMRGCPNRCRFCQARCQYYPYRSRKPETVLKLAEALYRDTGYEEISLAGLSVSDYPRLKEVLLALVKRFKSEGVGVSLPSIKPQVLLGELSNIIASIRKTGLTFAPEAGSERLRRRIGKDFSEQELFQTLGQAYQAGYQHVKLYFMIGLPGENEADLDAIIDFAQRVSELRKKIKGGPAQVNISVSTLIPKPHTPFQWLGMAGMDEIRRRQEYIRARCRSRNLRFSFHNRWISFLEAVFSRGDRRLSPVVLAAFKKGCRFDGWDEYLNPARWSEAFAESGIDPAGYLAEKPESGRLAWDFIDLGVPKEELLREYRESRKE